MRDKPEKPMTTDKDTEALIATAEDIAHRVAPCTFPSTNGKWLTAKAAALAALRAQQDRIKELEADCDRYLEGTVLGQHKVSVLEAKLAEAMDALGSPDEWAEKRKELEGWTGSAWIAGEGDEDLRSECYSFLCGLFGWLHAAETASRALMQKMEGTDANNG